MALESGDRLGPYQILSPIASGGMGEVFKAKDTRLDRTVAIKVLPDHLASDEAFRERFEREAKTVSGLNHPHICTLHDVGHENGIDYLVMELLEGETLQQRLKRGPLPMDECLTYATEIAGALDRAHREGIVHRDLKPGNIFLTKSGAKLLDFGLAKIQTGPSSEVSGLSALPTEQRSLTRAGAVLGTFQYMAPEQLEAKEADVRSDIFSLGAVLFEMVTGRKAFEASSQALLITAIMSQVPPALRSVKPEISPALERCVAKCLVKEPDARWHSARDLKDELEWIAAGGGTESRAPALGKETARVRLVWATGGLILGALLATILTTTRSPSTRVATARFTIELPFSSGLRSDGLALSPDGRDLVYAGTDESGNRRLYRRSMEDLEAVPIPGTEGGQNPFFSPDGRWIGFFSGGLKKVALSGGPPLSLAESSYRMGGTWGDDDTIVYAQSSSPVLSRVPAAGGVPEPLDQDASEVPERWPFLLPGARAVLFTLFESYDKAKVAVRDLTTGETEILLPGTQPRYLETGHLLFAWEQALWAVPFDLDRLELSGEPTRVVDGLQVNSGGQALYTVSRSGTLVYLTGSISSQSRLFWKQPGGNSEPVSERGAFTNPELSLDGTRLSVVNGDHLWLFDLARGVPSRFSVEGTPINAVWSPDGARLAVTSITSEGTWGIFEISSRAGPGPRVLLLDPELDGAVSVSDWSNDGRYLICDYGDGLQRDIGVLPLLGIEPGEPFPYLDTQFFEAQAQLSPDGQWLAYTSNAATLFEVYVGRFPEPTTRWQVSSGGGLQPRWSHDGNELYYVAGESLVSVAVRSSAGSLDFDPPIELMNFGPALTLGPGIMAQYDVSPEGDRFLTSISASEGNEVQIVLGWLDELERLAPRP